LSENISIPVNTDGVAAATESIPINIGAHIIMLVVEPESNSAVNDMFAAPVKVTKSGMASSD
jgi:hypothetical protein